MATAAAAPTAPVVMGTVAGIETISKATDRNHNDGGAYGQVTIAESGRTVMDTMTARNRCSIGRRRYGRPVAELRPIGADRNRLTSRDRQSGAQHQ